MESADNQTENLSYKREAAATLRDRLAKGFVRMYNGAAISGYISNAEYQLFLESCPKESSLAKPAHWQCIYNYQNPLPWEYQPPHWVNNAFWQKEQATWQPLTGLTVQAAEAFCLWLAWFNDEDSESYRLPHEEELFAYPTEPTNLAAWSAHSSGYKLASFNAETEKELLLTVQNLQPYNITLPLPQDLDLLMAFKDCTAWDSLKAHTQALANALKLTQAETSFFYQNLGYATSHGYEVNLTRLAKEALLLATDFKEVYAALEIGQLAEAEKGCKMLRQSSVEVNHQRATLLYYLLEMWRACQNQNIFALRQAAQHYALYYAEYSFKELQKSSLNPTSQKQAARLYFAARILLERREKNFPVWEALRIVRTDLKAG